ncbi:MFS transporter [Cytobacillus gottheilii]|uniref:MFS transporter n=1 Tax=Cytobacillus gottheilii TaxID=859144 RepID=UPI0024952F48|nr:MFS transporter [Cytobacillus gottheilii]
MEKALVADLATSGAKGTALGFYSIVTGIGPFPASLLTGWLWQTFGAETSFYLNGIIAVFASVLLFIILPSKKGELIH